MVAIIFLFSVVAYASPPIFFSTLKDLPFLPAFASQRGLSGTN
jgi:hypothetical protein